MASTYSALKIELIAIADPVSDRFLDLIKNSK